MEVRKSPQESYSQPLEEEVDPDSVYIGLLKDKDRSFYYITTKLDRGPWSCFVSFALIC